MFEFKRTPEFERLKAAEYFVEATDTERFYLWKENDSLSGKRSSVKWQDEPSGFSMVVGELAGHPVNVSFSFAKINGRSVCFYEAISQVVHHGMVREWLREKLDVQDNHCNAMNIHLCFNAIEAKGGSPAAS